MANISKQGVVTANNFIENYQYTDTKATIGKEVRPNILTGMLEIYTNKSGTINSIKTVSGLPAATVQSLVGQTLCLSYEVCTIGDRYSTEQGQTAYNYTRYGVHGSCTMGSSTSYPFAGELNYSGVAKRCYQTWTIPTGKSSYGGLGLSVQNFDKPASTNGSLWFLRNIKLEIGNYPTAFVLPEYTQTGDSIITEEFIEI